MRFILSFCCAAGAVLAPQTALLAQTSRPALFSDPVPTAGASSRMAQANEGSSGQGAAPEAPSAQPPTPPTGPDQGPVKPDTPTKPETKANTDTGPSPTLTPVPNVPNTSTGNIGNTTSDPSRTTSNPANTTSNAAGTTRDTARTTSDPSRRTLNAGTLNQDTNDLATGRPAGTLNPPTSGPSGTGPGRTGNQPVDDYGQNTRPALGSTRPADTGVNSLGSQGRLGNLNNPQSGLSQSLDNAYGRTLTNPSTLGPNARGGFFPTPPTASNALKPNSGYGTPTGARPSHMDARGIQRVN